MAYSVCTSFPMFSPSFNTGNMSKRTLQPITTGTSVLGLVFDGGVILAADTLGSYGSLAKFRQCPRLMKVNDGTILACDGDYADYQFLSAVIEQKMIDEECLNDGFDLKPRSLFCWLTRVLYNRRSKFDPLWNTYIVGGIQNGTPFLGSIDKLGTSYERKSIATGYGAYLAQPYLSGCLEKNPNLSESEAREALQKCLQILLYRDARAFKRYQLAVVTSEGSRIEGPFETTCNWEIALMKKDQD